MQEVSYRFFTQLVPFRVICVVLSSRNPNKFARSCVCNERGTQSEFHFLFYEVKGFFLWRGSVFGRETL